MQRSTVQTLTLSQSWTEPAGRTVTVPRPTWVSLQTPWTKGLPPRYTRPWMSDIVKEVVSLVRVTSTLPRTERKLAGTIEVIR